LVQNPNTTARSRIHTWPEYSYAAVDLFTCGLSVDPWKAFDILKDYGLEVEREGNGDISVKIHYKERVLDILSILKSECIEYSTIDIRRSNLEEIFLKLTGARLSGSAS